MALGEFRDDLYYRLNVLNIYSAAAARAAQRHSAAGAVASSASSPPLHDRSFRGITADAMALLIEAPWPGNVRQLRNLIESMVVLAPGREIQASDIPADILEGAGRLLPVRIASQSGGSGRPGD